MKFLAVVVGFLMLGPGLCSLLFTPIAFGGDAGLLVFWLAGLAIGLGGIFLIRNSGWK